MPAFGELIDDVVGILHGYVDQPLVGTLTQPISATDTTMLLDFGDQPGAGRPNGVVEVDRELMVVSRFDASSGTATLTPWGRGHQSTVAATHAAGAKVTVRPRFPRTRVAGTINEVLRSSCPPLFAARDLAPIDTGTLIGLGYPLPDDTIRVLRVDETQTGLSDYIAHRAVYRHWTVRNVAGQQLLEVDRGQWMETLQVTIAASPGQLVNDTDDFATVTGLEESCADLAKFGALARLVMGAELARQQLSTVEANMRADKVPAGSGIQVSRYYQALYTQRLQAEQDRLNAKYPIQLLRRG